MTIVACASLADIPKNRLESIHEARVGFGLPLNLFEIAPQPIHSGELSVQSPSRIAASALDTAAGMMFPASVPNKSSALLPVPCDAPAELLSRTRRACGKTVSVGFRPRCICCRTKYVEDCEGE